MSLAIFENYSQTIEGKKYAPFIVDVSQVRCFDRILKWLKNQNTQDLLTNDYYEVFYKQDDFEITVTVSYFEGKGLVNASVFGPRGKTRKKLLLLLSDLMKLFA